MKMKIKSIFMIIFILLFSVNTWAAEEGMISYKIADREEMRSVKLSLDVRVNLVNGRLPNKQELGVISNYLVSKERRHDRTFVLFYLPGMKIDAGAYATAHHNPKMEVQIMKYMLYSYPQYQIFLD